MARSRIALLLGLALAPGLFGCHSGSSAGGIAAAQVAPQALPAMPSPGGVATLNGFVENRGQWPDEVLFFARRGGVEATVLRDALAFRPASAEGAPAPAPLILHLPGDATERVVEGLEPVPTQHHFLLARRAASGAGGFERVALRAVLPGVDVVLRAGGGAFEYDLVLAPGAALEDLTIEVEGAASLAVRDASTLVLQTPAGEVEQRIHAAWQGAEREPVSCRFRALEPAGGRLRFGFEAPARDQTLALVLDPSLVYLTYAGGPGTQEFLIEAVIDGAGSQYLLGQCTSGTPVTPGSFQEAAAASTEAWIGKLSPDGTALEWATFLGASQSEQPADLALTPNGSVVVVGSTWSPDFPATPGAFQEHIGGGGTSKGDVFVARLDPTGSSLEWATFYGAENHDTADACAIYPDGDVLVAFEPLMVSLPSTPGVIDEVWDAHDMALVRLSADGTQRLWQTYFHASTIDDILIDDDSNAHLVGNLQYLHTPPFLMTTPGAYKEATSPDDSDGFVTKLNAEGNQLIWSTYLGGDLGPGADSDRVYSIALDPAGAIYVGGSTSSKLFPTTPAAFQSTAPDGSAGFVTKLLPNATGLVWSTYIDATGFPGFTYVRDVGVDRAGNAFSFALSNELLFPVTPDAFQPVAGGGFANSDGLLCKLDAAGEGLVYGTWLGGHGGETRCHVIVDADGDAHLAFQTDSTNLPVTPGAFQPTYGGRYSDMAAARFDFDLLPWTVLGSGLAGKDIPVLVGLGPLTAGSTTRLSLRGAPSLNPAWIVAGVVDLELPFLGGTLVPFPTVVIPQTTGALGELDFTFPWPSSPAGTEVFFQVWTPDALAPQGWSASHGLKATSQ